MPSSEYLDSSGVTTISALRKDFRRIPAELRNQLRPALRAAGQEILRTAALNSMWSSRIPAALELRVSFSGRRSGVFIRVDKAKAPHARPFEGILADTWRHPIFGNRTVWVEQASRPFLLLAVEENAQSTSLMIADAIDKAMTKTGF